MLKAMIQAAQPHDGAQPDETELLAAKEVLAALAGAVKNYALYPSNHSIAQKSVRYLSARMARFFKTYDCELKLDITKSGLVYKGIPIHSASADSDPLVGPFFRDGVLWMALLPGIESYELELFFRIVCEHRILKDEAESDLVTALWKANLPHLRYEAIASFWEARPVFDFNDFSIGDQSAVPKVPNQVIAGAAAASESVLSSDKTRSDREQPFFALTPTENELLAELISQNAMEDKSEDVVDILLIILADQKKEDDFIYLLDLLQEEFKLTLAEANFHLSYTLLKGIKNLLNESSGIFPSRPKLIHDFFYKISFDEILEALEPGLLKLRTTDSESIQSFRKVILLLDPQAVYTLSGLLLKLPSRILQVHLMDLIARLSLRSLVPLERLLNHSNSQLVKNLVGILGRIRGQRPRHLLLRMMGHESGDVRQLALRGLIRRGELPTEKIIVFLEDGDPQVRFQILNLLGRERNPMVERLLRDYIDHIRSGNGDCQFLNACYQAFGKCASNESLTFLTGTLFEKAWLGNWRRKRFWHRQGAAIALIELGTQEGKAVLQTASRSFYPGIRKAYKKALEFKFGVK